jgi:hypothetical protein
MEYRIDNNSYQESYSKEEIQELINDKKIGINTKIWCLEWGKWKKIRDTDFDLSKSKDEYDSDLSDNLFLSIKPYLNYIDNGQLFRKPFSLLYGIIAIINLILPFYMLYEAYDKNLLESKGKYLAAFIIVLIIISFASWISFQLWWDRKSKVNKTSALGDDFVATPVYSHFIQTVGEWLGTWIGIVGFFVSLITIIILGDESDSLFDSIGIDFIDASFFTVFLMPIYGFLIIVGTRFIAEQFRALSSIANNTKKI